MFEASDARVLKYIFTFKLRWVDLLGKDGLDFENRYGSGDHFALPGQHRVRVE